MLNIQSSTACPAGETGPSYDSLREGLSPPKTSRVPFQEISRSEHSTRFEWKLQETNVEVECKFIAEVDPYFSTRRIKKSHILPKFKFDLENFEANIPLKTLKTQHQKQPNQLLLENAPFASRSTASFRSTSTGDHMIVENPSSQPMTRQVPKGNLINTQKFHCFEDKNMNNQMPIHVLKDKKDPNLDYITPSTLIELMNNQKFELQLLDCRYDYEFRGGHIENAIHMNGGPQMIQELFFNPERIERAKKVNRQLETLVLKEEPEKETIIVLYCEFSQKRAPQVLRALRNIDRNLNAEEWPNLYYPRVYLLEGGYNNFYAQYPEVCAPNGYVEMLDLKFKKEYYAAKDNEKRAWNPRAYFDLENPDTFTLRASKRREDF